MEAAKELMIGGFGLIILQTELPLWLKVMVAITSIAAAITTVYKNLK